MNHIVPEGFLNEATELFRSDDIEANVVRRRTVVGRVYYAAYHACLMTAIKLGYDQKSRSEHEKSSPQIGKLGSHAYLIWWLTNFNHSTVKGIGRELERLKEFRCSADYDNPFSPPTMKDIDFTMKKAEILIKTQCPAAVSMICKSKNTG